MAAFQKEILTRFIGTDEREVTEYLGCELIRDIRLSKADCRQVVDPALHRAATAALLMLVVFGEHDEARSRVCMSQFVQFPGVVHLQAAERVLQHACYL
jgi:hypothetical protein